ncbi:MAG: FixH family protein [Burkholderiaceae bacterium]|nr:FixH family protein [Burkholderiaceae bacterium]MCD8517694.1 FixH family protein [Burkholderiaceae bacterium]MCD8536729.1 FixH family protein [Burkholderiaceae bacterium]MCD8564690.1 FixH family protein [Burkholderiaceae bacterium]
MKREQPTKPWWREPWPWFLMLGPFVAIIACAITISLALENFKDQPIYDGGVKRGLVVEKPADPSVSQQR